MEDDNNYLQQMRKGFFGKSTSNVPVVDVSLSESFTSGTADSENVHECGPLQPTASNGDHIEKSDQVSDTENKDDQMAEETEVAETLVQNDNRALDEKTSEDVSNSVEQSGDIKEEDTQIITPDAAIDDSIPTATKIPSPERLSEAMDQSESGITEGQDNIIASDSVTDDVVGSNSPQNEDGSSNDSPMEEDDTTADPREAGDSDMPDSSKTLTEDDGATNGSPVDDQSKTRDTEELNDPVTPKSLRKRPPKVDAAKSETTVKTRRSGRLSISKETPAKKSQIKTSGSTSKTAATVETDLETPVVIRTPGRPRKTPTTAKTDLATPAKTTGSTRKTPTIAETDVDTPIAPRSTRQSSKGSSKATQEIESSAKKTPSKKSEKSIKATPDTPSTHDPYDFDTEKESHPEPLKNIRLDFTTFGSVKYNRIGAGKYEHTEKTAEARVSSLGELIPHTKERRSLAELTPGSKKKTPRSATIHRKANSDVSDSEEVIETPVSKTNRKRRTDSSKVNSAAKRVKEEAVLPELDAEHLWSVDHPADDDTPHEEGARVFALYDKIFYPAVVSVAGKDSLGRYKVVFVADRVVQSVPASGVIPLRALLADHKCLFTADPEDDPIDATVISSPNAASAVDWKKGEFLISPSSDDSGDTNERVTWEKLSLSSEEWKEYIHKKSKQTSQVMLDNISNVEEKRGRRSRISGNQVTDVKSDLANPKTSESTDIENDQAPNKTLFSGMIFILTSAQRDGQTTFRKKLMSDFIEEHDGTVVDDFISVDSYPEKKAYLISDTHYRTYKYLSAMARGVPCVSHEWIWKCRDDGELVSHEQFILPAGISIIDQQIYPLPKNPGELLKNKVVLLNAAVKSNDSKVPSFVEVWEPIVKHLGGNTLSTLPDDGVAVDILLADKTVSADFLELAKANNAMMASSEWLIQSLIMEELQAISSHPRFSYDATR